MKKVELILQSEPIKLTELILIRLVLIESGLDGTWNQNWNKGAVVGVKGDYTNDSRPELCGVVMGVKSKGENEEGRK